jgi:hypothetical protein
MTIKSLHRKEMSYLKMNGRMFEEVKVTDGATMTKLQVVRIAATTPAETTMLVGGTTITATEEEHTTTSTMISIIFVFLLMFCAARL